MEPMMTMDVSVKAEFSIREVVNQFLLIPIERRLPMLDRLTGPKTVGDHKVYLKNAILFLTKNDLTPGDVGPLLTEIWLFEKELNRKHTKLQKEHES